MNSSRAGRSEPWPGDEGGAAPNRPSQFLRLLLAILTLLLLTLLAGTVWGLATGSRAKALAREAAVPVEGSDIFDLGQIRARSADPKAALIAARISFPYPAAATSFKEELERKAPALRAAASSYLSTKRQAELLPSSEGALKAGLLGSLNALLSLGKLEEIWLSDFAVLQ